MPERKATGSAALVVALIVADVAGLLLTYFFGAIAVPIIGTSLAFLWTHFTAHLRYDLWLFLFLVGLAVLLVIVLFAFGAEKRKDQEALFGCAAGSTLLLLIVCALLEWFWHINVTLGFIAAGPPTVFISPRAFIASPNKLLGLLWLGYYILVHVLTPLLRVSGEPTRSEWKNEEAEDGTTKRVIWKETIPVSRVIPGGPRDTYIKRCYELLRQALSSWDPPLLPSLQFPPIAYYEGEGELFFQGKRLLVPEKLLDPAQTEVLLPALARKLAYYNGPDWKLGKLMDCYPNSVGLLALTGNFIWLPVIITSTWWKQWKAEQTLEIDRFVHACGQSPALLHDLRKMRYDYQRDNVIDSSWPTLAERIDQLEMLIGQEQLQMKNQGIQAKTAPQVEKGAVRKQLQ